VSNPKADDVGGLSWLLPTSPLRRATLGLLASLLVLTIVAWALTIYQAVGMTAPMGIVVRGGVTADGMAGMAMAGMSATGWSVSGAATFVAVWTVMMVAMMLPAAAPMIVIFASANARAKTQAAVPTWIFAVGYILVWAAAGLLVYVLIQIGSDAATRLAPAARMIWAPVALGATLVVAGVYQFTPLKRWCLRHCRSPMAFVIQHWRDGRVGALRMGVQHGGYCFGCCWALFAVLVAAGVMSLAWMLLLTLVVFVEKMLPQARLTRKCVGFALMAGGIAVAAGVL
jgi:predicted metal-binding membrane protein